MFDIFTLWNVSLSCSRVESPLTVATLDIVWILTPWWRWKVRKFATLLHMLLHLSCSSNCLDKVLYNRISEIVNEK